MSVPVPSGAGAQTTRRLAEVEPPGGERRLLQYAYMCGVWYLSTYTACDLRCSYCVTYAQGPSTPRVASTEVVDQLRAELAEIPPDGVVTIGGLIDGYPHAEGEFGVTRLALEELLRQGRTVNVVTKGRAVLRDADLLAASPRTSVCISLLTTDDGTLARLEPHTPSATERLAVVHGLRDAGIDVTLLAQPWIPGISDAEGLIESAGPGVRVTFGPLNVQSPLVAGTSLARGLTQREIGEAYAAERSRIGRRRNVTWQAPGYLGADLVAEVQRPMLRVAPGPACEARPRDDDGVVADQAAWRARPVAAPTGTRSQRNVAALRRFVDAFNQRSLPLVAVEVLSPYLKGHDHTGRTLHPTHPRSGYLVDTFGECARCMVGARAELHDVEAAGSEVRVRLSVTGTLVEDMAGYAGQLGPVQVEIRNRYRFDQHGLVVEYWQEQVDVAPRPVEGVGRSSP